MASCLTVWEPSLAQVILVLMHLRKIGRKERKGIACTQHSNYIAINSHTI